MVSLSEFQILAKADYHLGVTIRFTNEALKFMRVPCALENFMHNMFTLDSCSRTAPLKDMKQFFGENPSKIEWNLTNGPRSVSCDRAIRYSGLGVLQWVLLEISWKKNPCKIPGLRFESVIISSLIVVLHQVQKRVSGRCFLRAIGSQVFLFNPILYLRFGQDGGDVAVCFFSIFSFDGSVF